MIPLLPFTIEITADPLLIKAGKKDLSWKVRTVMIALACLACWLLEGSEWNVEGLKVVGRSLCLALAPFCFFDLCLNLLRGEKWYYQSTTNGKWWDMKLAGINHWAVLAGRCLGFAVFMAGYLILSNI